jgi:hypothetical protein
MFSKELAMDWIFPIRDKSSKSPAARKSFPVSESVRNAGVRGTRKRGSG